MIRRPTPSRHCPAGRRALPPLAARTLLARTLLALPLLVLTLLILTAFAAPLHGQGGGAPAADSAQQALDLAAVPEPFLDDLDPAVAEQLQQARAELTQALATASGQPAAQAAILGELGTLYLAYELDQPAEAALSNAATLAPQDLRWHYYLGYLYQQAGQLPKAEERYVRAFEINPVFPPLMIRLGQVLLALNRPDEAAEWFQRALDENPSSPAAIAGLGEVALVEQRYQDAVTALGRALEQVPDANRLHYSLALAYRGLGQMDRARQEMERRGTVGVKPQDPLIDGLTQLLIGERVHMLRGFIAFRAGAYADAAAEYRKAVAAAPERVAPLLNLGSALGQAGEKEEAKATFRRVLEIEAENQTALFNLAVMVAGEGDHAGAVGLLERALAVAPQDAQALFQMARSQAAIGEREQAIGFYRRAVERDMLNPELRLELAEQLGRSGEHAAALAVIGEGQELMPREPRLVSALALLLAAGPELALRDGERALGLAERLFEASPTVNHAALRAMAHAEMGDCEKATEIQRLAIEAAQQAEQWPLVNSLARDLVHYEQGEGCRPRTRAGGGG